MLEQDCVFCKIIQGEIPCKKFYEDDNFLAIFDIQPISEGHVILMSKNHYYNTKDMPSDEWFKFMIKARDIAEDLVRGYAADGYNLLINQGEAAQSGVAHRPHCHIIPRRKGDTIKIDPR